ncbi:MAG: hypothetical protein Q9191_005624 [Dirinaria sp. TL-2023a]
MTIVSKEKRMAEGGWLGWLGFAKIKTILYIRRDSGPALPALGHGVAGSAGAAISNLATYPLGLIITRLQLQRQLHESNEQGAKRYTSILDAAVKIYSKEGGIADLYTGIVPDTFKTVADSFLFFLAYTFLRQSRIRARGASESYLPVLDELSVGFLAGAFSKLLTTPVANIVTRKQASNMLSEHASRYAQNESLGSIALQIHSKQGFQGYWSGYTASMVLTLNPSLTFFFYELFKSILLPSNKKSRPAARITFLLAAVSKALASSITYPFAMAKSRAQAPTSRTGGDNTAKVDSAEEGLYGPNMRSERSRNVFSMVNNIARTEGIGALYQGVDGEVLKGFFSHGLTMIMKDTVHSVIIQLYYTILKLSKRYSGPEKLTRMAKQYVRTTC